nr:type II toxin-antitoxin system HicA family toxin [Thiocapsa sp.]
MTCAEVKLALKVLGFTARPGRGGSHEHWVKDTPDGRRKVTVDCPKAPFSQTLIDSMRRQAGVTKAEFYRACGR